MEQDNDIIKIENLCKNFGGLQAISDVSLCLEKDTILGLIGPNGAGKTTIFNMLTGILSPTSGRIYYENREISNLKPFEVANAGIARTFQNIRLFGQLSVNDNVLTACQKQATYGIAANILKVPKFRREEKELKKFALELVDILGLSDRKNVLAKNLPYGLQRRLEIARALALRPKVLLLDEPAAGMNDKETMLLESLIKSIKKEFSLSIIIIEHHMNLIMNVCDRIAVLNFGKLICLDTPESVQSDPAVIEAYIGVEDDAKCSEC